MPLPADTRAAATFRALGDETRLALLTRLGASGPLSVSQLAEGTAMTRQAVSKHLAVLARAGLARDSRHGREHRWEADPEAVAEARRALDMLAARWQARLEKFKELVEAEN